MADGSRVDVTGAFAVGSGNSIGTSEGKLGTSAQYAIAMGEGNMVDSVRPRAGASSCKLQIMLSRWGPATIIGGHWYSGNYGLGPAICAFAEGSGNIIGGNSTANYAIAMGEGNSVGFLAVKGAPYAFAQGKSNIIAALLDDDASHAIAMGSSNVVEASFGVAIGEEKLGTCWRHTRHRDGV